MCVTEPFPFGRDCFPLLLTSPVCGAQPERIQGAQYTVKSDVWSLGISLIELALGRFPFSDSSSDDDSDLSDFEGTLSPSRPMSLGLPPPRGKSKPMRKELDSKEAKRNKRKSKGVSLQGGGMTMSILELLQHIVNEPAPRLTPEGRFPKEAEDFVDSCLLKDPDQRRTPKDLLVSPTPVGCDRVHRANSLTCAPETPVELCFEARVRSYHQETDRTQS